MTLLNSQNPELTERMANLCDALDDLGQAPDGPRAWRHWDTIEKEQAHIARLVQEGTPRIQKAARMVAARCITLPAPVAVLPVGESIELEAA